MSVTATNVRTSYTSDGSGTTLVYGFTFQILSDLNASVTVLPTDVSVYFNGVIQPTNSYTVNGPFAGTNPNSVVLNAGTQPAAGVIITIVRNKPLTQTTRFLDGSPFPASSFELALDKLTMILQQLNDMFTQLGFLGVLVTDAAPTTGTFTDGQWYLAPNPFAGGHWGWVCVASGTPGTWSQFGPISL